MRSDRFTGKGHILVLGWSETDRIVLAELAQSGMMDGRALVILSESGSLAESGEADFGKTRVLRLEGSPADPANLERAAVDTAFVVLVNNCGESDGDAQTAAAAEALSREFERLRAAGRKTPRAIAVTEAASAVIPEGIVSVCCETVFPRLVAQVSRQRFLALVYDELFSFRGNEIYFLDATRFAGSSWGHLLRIFPRACPVGIIHGGATRVNPAVGTKIAPGDRIALIAENRDRLDAEPLLLPIPDESAIATEPLPGRGGESFLVLGWNRLCPAILRELGHYAAPDSRVTVIVPDEATREAIDADTGIFPGGPLALSVRVGPFRDADFLSTLEYEYFENILIPGDDFPSGEFSGELSGELSLDVYKTLSEALGKRGFRPNVTTVVAHDREGGLAEGLISPDILFRTLAQLLLNEDFLSVFSEITTPIGAEIYLKPVENYVNIEKETNFYTILEAARRRNETVIGYVSAEVPKVCINPDKKEKKQFYHFDRIVLVADES